MISYCWFFILIKKNNNLLYIYDYKTYLDLIHFQSLYPSLSKESREETLLIQKQEAIGICVNFNFDPDKSGNTLASILYFYTKINKYIVILTPSTFDKLSDRNINLLNQFNVRSILINHNKSNNVYGSFIDNSLKQTSNVYHMECLDSRSGYLQHKCLLLCAQFYSFVQIKDSNIRGILYLPDDIYFNFGYVFSHPERFSLDEIWTTPWTQLVDIIQNDKGLSGNTWWWWNNKPHLWESFRQFFLSNSTRSEEYRRIFKILYGLNKQLAVAIADILYLPFADNQLKNLILITNELMKDFPSDMFCEIIFPLIVDLTMSISNHWPFQNDREIYNSSVNRLNNLSIIEQMERTNLIKSARDPYSRNIHFRQRPCLFNPDGFIWDQNRQNEYLFYNAIINGTVPQNHLLKPWKYRTEFIHPMKLSNNNHWAFQLWHQGMKQQIEQLKQYQKYKTKIF
jgi:hypothetical protein